MSSSAAAGFVLGHSPPTKPTPILKHSSVIRSKSYAGTANGTGFLAHLHSGTPPPTRPTSPFHMEADRFVALRQLDNGLKNLFPTPNHKRSLSFDVPESTTFKEAGYHHTIHGNLGTRRRISEAASTERSKSVTSPEGFSPATSKSLTENGDVYHTIHGCKARGIATSRNSEPFSKILLKPFAHSHNDVRAEKSVENGAAAATAITYWDESDAEMPPASPMMVS